MKLFISAMLMLLAIVFSAGSFTLACDLEVKSPCSGLKSFSSLPVLDGGLPPAVYVDADLYYKVLKQAEWACQVKQRLIEEDSFEVAKGIFDQRLPHDRLIIKIHVTLSPSSSRLLYLFTYIKKGYDKK